MGKQIKVYEEPAEHVDTQQEASEQQQTLLDDPTSEQCTADASCATSANEAGNGGHQDCSADDALDAIKLARDQVRAARGKYLLAKEDAKAAKDEWQGALTNLQDVIDAMTRPLPLFEQSQAQKGSEVSPQPTDATTDTQPHDDQAWRAFPISDLGLSDKTTEKILAKCQTLGDFSDLMAKHGDFWHKEFKGLRRADVEDAWATFWDHQAKAHDAQQPNGKDLF